MDENVYSELWTFRPPSLYSCCTRIIASNFQLFRNDIRTLPGNIFFDIVYEVFNLKKYSVLAAEFKDPQEFYKLLLVKHRRSDLLRCFQKLIDEKTCVESECISNFSEFCDIGMDVKTMANIAISLGEFLNEGGWYTTSITVLLKGLELIKNSETENKFDPCDPQSAYYRLLLTLLHANVSYHNFEDAQKIFMFIIDPEKNTKQLSIDNSQLFTEFSLLFFYRYSYTGAHCWSIEALKALNDSTPIHIIINTLRQASKTFSIQKKLKEADFLINQALILGEKHYGRNSLGFADVLCDFGFYLLHSDSIHQSVYAYEAALGIKLGIFGRNNLRVAILEEDLAYSAYVQDYNHGRFEKATKCAENAINSMQKILPPNHMILASAQRVKALIVEEIALDIPVSRAKEKQELFLEAEALHNAALESAQNILGEKNLLTAKHYGNLGRLYQSMQKFKESKQMHNKSINIKECILGPDHYEVGLSVGHLASLYNYQLGNYKKAEQLYLRALAINSKLFGDSYSGLEYDYKGLIYVYEKYMDLEKITEYTQKLHSWKRLREDISDDPQIVMLEQSLLSIEEIKKKILAPDEKTI